MVIYALTNKVYTHWGLKYSSVHWRPSWWVYINLANNERKSKAFNEYKPINYIISWFDINIIQRIGRDCDKTLRVRIRIVCGLVNKLSPVELSPDMRYEFMECIWDAYNKFQKEYIEWKCKYILGLPF